MNISELERRYLPLLLARLWRERRTATVRHEGPAGTREVLLVAGEIRAARSEVVGERLGEWLVARGRLAAESLAAALLRQVGSDAPPLGHVLVVRGLVGRRELEAELAALTRAILAAACRDTGGSLAVDPTGRPGQPDTLPGVATQQLLLEAARAVPPGRRAELPGFPSTAELVVTERPDLSTSSLELTPLERTVLGALEEPASVASIAARLARDPGEVAAAAWPLLVAGMVAPVEGEALPDRAELLHLAARADDLDHYRVLGLEPGASYREIYDAWEAAQARFDLSLAGRPGFEDLRPVLERLRARAEEAFETLSDPAQRLVYDRMVRTPRRPPEAPAATEGNGEAAGGPGRPCRTRGVARREIAAANLRRAREALAAGNLYEAHELLDQVCRLDPSPEALVALAQVQARNPRWAARALASLRRAVELDPGFVPAWLELATFWRRRGDVERQRKALERALAADPRHREARRAYAELVGREALERLLARARGGREPRR